MSMASSFPADVGYLLAGALSASGGYPLVLPAVLGDLRPRFLPKGRAGRGYRAVARNGRILLASDVAVQELAGRTAWVRVQTWHRRILPDDPLEPYGLLLGVRCAEVKAEYVTRLIPWGQKDESCLTIEVGGGMGLQFLLASGECEPPVLDP
jgi:hypothetical protein